MKTIGIISSPLQFTNFAEYVYQKKLDNYNLIVLYYSKLEISQINKLNSIYNIKIYKKVRGFPVLQYIWLLSFGLKIKSCDKIIIGNFFSDTHLYLSNIIKKNETVVIDDGIITHSIPDYNLTKKRIVKRNIFKSIIFKLFRINNSYPKKFSLFTIFNIDDQKNIQIEKNNLSYIKSKLQSKKQKKSALVIGQPFVELNMIDENEYINAIKKIISNFSASAVMYYPSRKEKEEKLSLIKQLNSIEIIQPETNIETYLIKSNSLPKDVIGFTSSALITINKILNSKEKLIDIYSCRLPLNQSRLSQDLIDKMYNRIISYGVRNITLS